MKKATAQLSWELYIDCPECKETFDLAENDDENKVNGTVRLYEFPGKVEAKLKKQITDGKNGLGPSIFDPGEDGYNFILEVGATKKQKNGKVWPDYSLSDFARKSYALGTDEEIKAIMSTTYDIDEYIQGRERDEQEIIDALKQNMMFDLVKNERKRAVAIDKDLKTDDVPKFEEPEDKDKPDEKKEDKPDEKKDDGDGESLSDADLLAQLDDL